MISAADIRRETAALAQPPLRAPVSEISEKYVKVHTSNGPAPWDPSLVPYMIEPMNLTTSRRYEALIFAGPARSSKTQSLIDCYVGYSALCDPSDIAVVQIAQEKAKDFSKLRINRLHRNSPEIGAKLSPVKHDDNVHEKYYRAGNVLKIIWPTVKQLSSSEFKTMLLTDYDRMPQNVDKEGTPFALAQKRTQTYMSRGMTVAESSPGFEIQDANWKPRSPHEAPPTKGILSLYNLGDRRRYYMPCPSCKSYFMPLPGIEAFSFNINKDLFDVTETELVGEYGLICTSCGEVISEDHKHQMNMRGMWVPEGCRITKRGKKYKITGTPRNTKIASFWLPGAAAVYQSWQSIIQRYLNALREYDLTGIEESLKATTNIDQGAPYLPRRMVSQIETTQLERRAEDLSKQQVPEGVRFLIASIDVQATRFVVQVTGYGVGFESWVIDRFDIHNSKRTSGGEPLSLDPAGYIEDWDLIIDKVMMRSYPLADGSGRSMAILRTGCDSGGKAGVTDRAYSFWRKLKRKGLEKRFVLVKGERPLPNARKPIVQLSFPDNTKRADRKAKAKGDVPLWILNTTRLKDSVMADIKREDAGPRFMHYPEWLGIWFYEELLAETRTDKGWENRGKQRNESFDLYSYSKGQIETLLIDHRIKEIDWEKPPAWAADWSNNSQIDLKITPSKAPAKKKRRRVVSQGVRK